MAMIATAFIWYLVVSAPQGGLVVMPSGFDSREQCEEALTEFNRKPAQGWTLACIPGGAAFDDPADDNNPGAPAQ